MHDLSVALRHKGACSAFSSGLVAVVAAVSLAALPGFSAASFVNVKYGSPWALIQANTEEKGLPTQISVGMFRICYASPGASCLAFSWGLNINQFSFQGADKWVNVLPPISATKAWPLLSAAAFFMTFMSAFTNCLNYPAFVIGTGIITFAVNLAYLSFTAYLFFSMRSNIIANTEYTPAPVLISAAMLGGSFALVLIVAFLTIFTKKRGDTLFVRHFSEGEGADGKGEGDAEKGSEFHDEVLIIHPRDSNISLIKPEQEEEMDKVESWREVIETDEHDLGDVEAAETVDMQLRFIRDKNYDPDRMKPGLVRRGRWRKHKKAPVPPNPHDEFLQTQDNA